VLLPHRCVLKWLHVHVNTPKMLLVNHATVQTMGRRISWNACRVCVAAGDMFSLFYARTGKDLIALARLNEALFEECLYRAGCVNALLADVDLSSEGSQRTMVWGDLTSRLQGQAEISQST
jgi:hypothetical protein